MVLLDTHIWLWWLLGDGPLSSKDRESLGLLAESRMIAISWVSIWEAEMLERKGRIKLLPDIETWVKVATDQSFCTVLPVDAELVLAQRQLPDYFHGDPADRLIVTTALLAETPLMTHDSRIINASVPGLTLWEA